MGWIITIILVAAGAHSALAKPMPVVCMATAIYYEARGETATAQKAVGDVIKSRASSNNKFWPDTICKVVTQRYRGVCQFTYVCLVGLRQPDYGSKEWGIAVLISLLVWAGVPPVTEATCYHAWWVNPKRAGERIGAHIFYKCK